MRTLVLVRSVALAGMLAVLVPATARAGSITLLNDFTGVTVHYFFQTSYPNIELQAISLGSVTMSGGTDLLPSLNSPNSFEAYCVDIITPVLDSSEGLPEAGGTYSATADVNMSGWSDPTGITSDLDAGRKAAWLYNRFAPEISLDPSLTLERTALQIALWEALYDTGADASFGAGVFYVAQGYEPIANRANEYLAELVLNSAAVATADAAWLQLSFTNANGTDIDAQDFIGPLGSTTPVPEPSAGLLLGMGAMSLAAFRSRRTFFRRS